MDRNKRPVRVGLVACAMCDGEKGNGEAARAIELLLDDAVEAGAAYERRSGAERPVEFARGTTAGCDAVILGVDGTNAESGGELGSLAAGTAVYAVCACTESRADEVLACLWALERACGQRGLAWRGGLTVEDAQVAAAFEHSPRLGFWRRPVSRGIDQMLLAVRCGSDASLEAVRPGALRRAYAALLLRRRSCRSR